MRVWIAKLMCVIVILCCPFGVNSARRSTSPRNYSNKLADKIMNVIILRYSVQNRQQVVVCIYMMGCDVYECRATIGTLVLILFFQFSNLWNVTWIGKMSPESEPEGLLGSFPLYSYISPPVWACFRGTKIVYEFKKNGPRWPGYVMSRWKGMRGQINFPNR